MCYNMTGADNIKCQWVCELAAEHEVDFCALQEHFKTVRSTERWFREQFSGFHTYVVPAYRAPGVDSGRGRGGLAQLALRSVAVARARVATKSPRLQAQLLTFPTCSVLWVNGYMPCDPQLQSYDDTELLTVLSEMERLVAAATDCEVVWAADLNWDRSRNNQFTRTVAAALERMGLTSVWEGRSVDYTHIHTDGISTSTIDHFLVSRRLRGLVEDCGPVHRGDNLSRHSPIFVSLRLGELPRRQAAAQPPPRRMPAWDRATPEELLSYTVALHQRLQAVRCPGSMVHCWDPLCSDTTHSEARDGVVLDILMSMVECSYTSLPLTGRAGGRKKRNIIPGWSTEVEPFRLESNLCYSAWLAAGKPRQGDVHEARIRSHAQFRHAVRRVKRAGKLHQAKGLFDAAMAGDIELMQEMKSIKSGKGKMDELAETVDGVTGEQEVAGRFREIFATLYSCSGSQEELAVLEDRIRQLVQTEDSKEEIAKVTPEVVKQAAAMMKSHKMDVSQGFSSDALLHAPDLLFSLLSLVFQQWLTHGTVTKSVLACAIIPLVKGSKNPALSGNYRAIAGSSLLLKLFERCTLLIWGDRLHSDSLQYGFKRRCSTGQATWLVQEVVQHYLHHGSRPVAVVLDCTKAFDLARYDILFGRLLQRGIPAIVVRLLAYSYVEQVAWVRWGRSTCSDTFRILNGTRQGSVASPAFWSVYLDPLFADLREAGVGCHIAGMFCGVVGYADDLLLLAPSREAAQKMLVTCQKFTEKNNIMSSTHADPIQSKSKAIYVVGPRGGALPRPAPLVLCGRPLPWVERADHLGHALHQDGEMRQDCREKRACFIDSSVKIREGFSFAHPAEQITAVEKYCTAAYGSNLWDLGSKESYMLTNAWRTGHKLAWGVPRACRTYLVQAVLAPHVASLRASLLHRFTFFFRGLLASASGEVAVMARLAARDVRSTIGSNLALVRQETGLDPWVAGRAELRAALEAADQALVPQLDSWRAPALEKLLTARLQAHYAGDKGEEGRLQGLIDSLVTN
jgi:hypothetical protein